jgi:hypothetical protein
MLRLKNWTRERLRVARLLRLVGFSFMALVGCDGPSVTSPGMGRAGPLPRATISEPTELGVGTLAPPPTTSPSDVASITLQPLVSIPESTWVVVRVEGQLALTWNSKCDQFPPGFYWQCMSGSPSISFGPVPGEPGPVGIWAEEGAYSQWVKLRGSGGGGDTPGSAVGLHFQIAAGQLSGKLNMVPQWAWDPNFGNGPFSYYVGGGYTVTATAVPNPIKLTDSEPDSTGTRTYSAEPLPGLEFSNPREWPFVWPEGAEFWAWVFGDSVSTNPNSGGVTREIPECQFHARCRYRPAGPGRMQLLAYVEGKEVRVRSEAPHSDACGAGASLRNAFRAALSADACGARAQLLVRCEPLHPPRAGPVVCSASVTENKSFEVIRQNGSGDGFHNDEVVHRHYGPGEVHSWAGPAVANTTVRFTAVIHDINDHTESETATFAPTARTWTDFQISVPVNDVRYELLPGKMTPYPLQGTTLGGMGPTGLNPGSMDVEVVAEGPDKGLSFLRTRPDLTGDGAVLFFHPELYPSHCVGSACGKWLADQNGRGGGTCTVPDVSRLRSEIERHEGLTGADSSHVQFGNYLLAKDKPQNILESFYRWRIDDDRFRIAVYREYRHYIDGPFDKQQDAFDARDYPRIWGSFACTFDFNPYDN